MDERNYEDVIQKCPKCMSSNDTKKALKFKVSYCGHSICDGCFALMFERNEEECTVCHMTLTKGSFRARKYDNDKVESYISHYNEVKRVYNCERIDFETLEEYNNYLEEVELLTIDRTSLDREISAAAKAKMNDYLNANKAAIKARRNRKNPDMEEYDRVERDDLARRLSADDQMRREKEARATVDEEYCDRLVNGAEPLDVIIREYSAKIQQDAGLSAGHGDVSLSILASRKVVHEAAPYRYERPSYMTRDSFSYRRNSEDSLLYDVLLQTLPDNRGGLRPGGGYTPQFWFHRLRHFCE